MTQLINWDAVANHAKAVWAVGGPLLGVLVGAYIVNRNQRKQWIAENKKQEYRELLSVMSKGFAEFLRTASSDKLTDDQINYLELKVADTVLDRIFTAAEIERLEVFSRWSDATARLKETGDNIAFSGSIDALLGEIRKAALKDIIK